MSVIDPRMPRTASLWRHRTRQCATGTVCVQVRGFGLLGAIAALVMIHAVCVGPHRGGRTTLYSAVREDLLGSPAVSCRLSPAC